MLTPITSLDQKFNANDVDIMIFVLCFLYPPAAAWGAEGGEKTHGR